MIEPGKLGGQTMKLTSVANTLIISLFIFSQFVHGVRMNAVAAPE